jgi:penicillin-binding protein 1A
MSRFFNMENFARALVVVVAVLALGIGIFLGVSLALTQNEINNENFSDYTPNLPTKLLDVKGRLITEFSSYEKREMINLDDVPKHLIYALITREDQGFFTHHGFSLPSIGRAFMGVILHRNLGGGSTITQQIAGTLKTDRDDRTVNRKLVELWWALQFERRFTKNEILELYINKVYFNDGYYGVESASKYFFGHSAREITLEESAVLALQVSSPSGRYNPFKNPANAKARSREVLNDMVRLGYCTKKDAEDSFNQYWDNFDYTRVPTSAFYNREDKARYFSEYVRRQLDDMLYGSVNYNEDGLTVYTTLNLDYQERADAYMKQTLEEANKAYKGIAGSRLAVADTTYIPMVNALSLLFDINSLRNGDTRQSRAQGAYQDKLNPVVDATALLFNLGGLKDITRHSYDKAKQESQKTTIEGALITLDNDTGYIQAMVGGSGFSQLNQTIRATQAQVSPGSTIKPLYYSAAIDSRKFTEGSLIYDEFIAFPKDDGSLYIPHNYSGNYSGPILLWKALAQSLNIPALRIFDSIGFDVAINRISTLLGVTDQAEIARDFPRYYPLALGTASVSPYQMARAYAIFANQGKEVDPIAIRSVESRTGETLIDVEKELRVKQKQKGQAMQVITPQTAYIMADMLNRITRSGTLYGSTQGGTRFTYADANGKKYTLPAGGKTGTSENWADAWTVGFTPYMTTAVWFGFDTPGNSMGVELNGEALAGHTWANYMFDINRGLGPRNFVRPQSGLVQVTVCAKSGQLPTANCTEGTVTLEYLEGTQPQQFCSLHGGGGAKQADSVQSIQSAGSLLNSGSSGGELKLDQSLFGDDSSSSGTSGSSGASSSSGTSSSGGAGSTDSNILN